jgi:hypothetical protein
MPILSHICRQTVRVTVFLFTLLVCFLPYLVDNVSYAELSPIALPSVSLVAGEESDRYEPAAESGRLHDSMLIQYFSSLLANFDSRAGTGENPAVREVSRAALYSRTSRSPSFIG